MCTAGEQSLAVFKYGRAIGQHMAIKMNAPLSNRKLMEVMLRAYEPCRYFGQCQQAIFKPSNGHIPRGYLGAIGELEEVEVVFVFAEPGHPHSDEKDSRHNNSPMQLLRNALNHTYQCFKKGTDAFHRNTRCIMNQLWPDKSFDQQLRHVWLTESRLCSIDDEIGNVADRTCAHAYLRRQLELMPQATVIAFGGKAQRNLKKIIPNFIKAYALAPPGANFQGARPSWEKAIATVRELRFLRS